uniref:MASE1 domain-containing protein n=1 Tax=Pseudomonas aeruginosa TaxID=287 RepID=UPI003CF90C26
IMTSNLGSDLIQERFGELDYAHMKELVLGVGKLRYPFLNLTWAVSTLCLLNYNQNFLQGVLTQYSLAFILAVLISFSVCLLYMVRIYHRSEWLNRRWHLQALTDPLTLLPNFRALEQAPEQEAGKSFCCLRID